MAVHPEPTILLTRPRAASERFASGLGGTEVVIAPLMEIVVTGQKVDLEGLAGVILTSANAVSHVPPTSLPVYCVGRRTAAAARSAGLRAEAWGGDAEAFLSEMLSLRPDGPLLHLHGVHTRGDVAERLSAAGIPTRGMAVYDQVAVSPSHRFFAALARPGLRVPLFSPRSAGLFAEAVPRLRKDTDLLAFSPAVAAALPTGWAGQIETLVRPDSDEMRAALLRPKMRRNSP